MIFPKYFTDQLTSIFLKRDHSIQIPAETNTDVDGEPMDDEVDGEPMEEEEEMVKLESDIKLNQIDDMFA